MNIFKKIFGAKEKPEVIAESAFPDFKNKPPMPAVQASSNNNMTNVFSFSVSYNGEKNLGELGPIKNYVIDYQALRARSWQAYLESEVAQTVIRRYTLWVVGAGLKLQSEPQKMILESEKININLEDFTRIVEARFKVYSENEMSTYSSMLSLHALAEEAYINAIVGGDVLVVIRYEDNQIKTQLIDGAHIDNPLGLRYEDNSFYYQNGNRIQNGIEIDATGKHVAYHVRTAFNKFERIAAIGEKSNMKMAFMIYGLKYRLNSVRGIPLIVAVMETMKKLERYKEATVGSAEERQKIAYFFEHQIASTGESPLGKALAKAYNPDSPTDLPVDNSGNQLANTVAATTNKQVFNMPQGSTVKHIASDNELNFKDFYLTNFDLVCATVGIPPNVASSKYDSNYSASRAAVKDWEHTINVARKKFKEQFYQFIYNVWLHKEILDNKIQADGYLRAYLDNNLMVLAAYRSARFVGANVPHIDPLKEVNAEREKLGDLAKNIPLTTVEAATEALNGGESMNNVEQFSKEMEHANKLNIPASSGGQQLQLNTM